MYQNNIDKSNTSVYNVDKTRYYYIKNLQGDVEKIIDKRGNVIASYVYDAWGNVLSLTDNSTNSIATLNPLRYRSYVYDQESGFYYLQSRYYDPQTGRFLNADDTAYLGATGTALSCNLFAYCENDVVNNVDPKGSFYLIDDMIAFGVALGALLTSCATLVSLVREMNSTEFKNSWNNFCIALDNGFSSLWNNILNGLKSAWKWSLNKIKQVTKAINQYVTASKADATIKFKVKKKSKDRYWQAWNKGSYVLIGEPIPYKTALNRVKNGKSVFTVTSNEAEALAKVAGGDKTPLSHPKHYNTVGYYKHYHTNGHSNGAHIWYLYS